MSKRIRALNTAAPSNGPVVYWMSRDQRIVDNWAFAAAQQHALETSAVLYVVFVLAPSFQGATLRQYHFLLEGLKETEQVCREYAVPFLLKMGDPPSVILSLTESLAAGAVFADFDPLKIKQRWKHDVCARINTALYEVDAHNIIPAWAVSPKSEYSAATFRKKYEKIVDEYLEEFPAPVIKMKEPPHIDPVDWSGVRDFLQCDTNVRPIQKQLPGTTAGMDTADSFLAEKIKTYNTDRNNPVKNVTSHLSPYLHYGHISAQRVALDLLKCDADDESKQAFWNEIVTWREVADNFCLYNDNYDNPGGFPNWALATLDLHLPDEREYLYSRDEFENGKTHEALWNAAQFQLVSEGRIHSYMRMYWAKKILEWSPHYEEAYETAVYLNDRYALDGRDPNGYAGIAWAIGGVHDRPWFERPVYGKIRYMNENGCRRKFDADAYIRLYAGIR